MKKDNKYKLAVFENKDKADLVEYSKQMQESIEKALDENKGEKGDKGDTGDVLPVGGTKGQVLTKNSETDGDASWKDSAGGDALPIGSIVDYDGDTVPEGYEEVEDTNNIYSTEETVIGKWLGKPLYRKVITVTLPSGALNSDYECADLSSLNIDKLVKLEGFIDAATTQVILNIAYKGNAQYCSCYYAKGNKKLRYITNNEQYVNVTAYITIEYTKTIN